MSSNSPSVKFVAETVAGMSALGVASRFLKCRILEIVLAACVIHLVWLCAVYRSDTNIDELPPLKNIDFPNTYIRRIHLDLTGPNYYVDLSWAGPDAAKQDSGPFHSSPGAGWGTNDCNDLVESNCPDSRCTPKGLRKVEGFMEYLKDSPIHKYVTLIDIQRRIGFHSSPVVEDHPASNGCVRLESRAARLIHDNSIVGRTEILIDGTWTNPREATREDGK